MSNGKLISKPKKAQNKTFIVGGRRFGLAWKLALSVFGSLLILIFIVYAAFRLSPWPGALIVRYFFDKGGHHTNAALEKYVPTGITTISNKQYRAHDKNAYLDVYYPATTPHDALLPTIVWVHGGAWVSGSKNDVANYLKILASHGYTTVGVNYSIAPGKHYPIPVLQVNDALHYLNQNAAGLHINTNKFALAGDSAGSQIAAQIGAIVTNPSYAQTMHVAASLRSNQLLGMVLNCGAYNLALPNYNGPDGKFLKTVLWAYSGTKDFLHDKNLQSASVVNYVNGNFPPTFITAGNADPLETQSKEFANKLLQLGVPTSTLFYTAEHQPPLQHEYQFNLDLADGKEALDRIVDFLHQRL